MRSLTLHSDKLQINQLIMTRSIWKMLGPFATASRRTPPVLDCHSPGVAAVARRLHIDVHNNIDNNDNAWLRGPLWPHGMGPMMMMMIVVYSLSSEVGCVRASDRAASPAVIGGSAGSRGWKPSSGAADCRHAASHRHPQTVEPWSRTCSQGGRGESAGSHVFTQSVGELASILFFYHINYMHSVVASVFFYLISYVKLRYKLWPGIRPSQAGVLL